MDRIDPKRCLQIMDNLKGKKILVIGDIMIDEYLWGSVNRLSPEAPVPIIEIEDESIRFGGSANVALNLKTLGCQPIMIGIVGRDRMGDHFFELLDKFKMPKRGIIQTADRPTTTKTRIIGENQHIARVDRETAEYIQGNLLGDIRQRIDQLIGEVEAIVLQDYNKGVLDKQIIQHTIAKANTLEKIVTVDPKFINFLAYSNATVFKPNIKETSQALARLIQTEEDIRFATQLLGEKLAVKNVLLTLGARGMALYEASGEYSRVATKTLKVADVSGAGDTVISTLTAALVGGASMKEAASLANYAAGIVCGEVGIVPIEAARLLKEIELRSCL